MFHRRDRMLVGFATILAISAHPHKGCVFESRSRRGVLDATLRDKVFVSDCGRSVVFSRYSCFPTGIIIYTIYSH
jgi:hypothetical protein